MIKSATVAELKQWLETGEAVLVDVRENDEYAAGYIAGSVHVPLAQVVVAKIPAHKGKKLVMQCKSGGRSRVAAGKLLQETQNLDVYNLEGGIMAWQQAGYAVAK